MSMNTDGGVSDKLKRGYLLIAPAFVSYYGENLITSADHQAHFQSAGIFLLSVITSALFLSCLIRETAGMKCKKQV